MLKDWIKRAERDEPVWLPELRAAFAASPECRPLYLRLTLHDASTRDFSCPLPHWQGDEEARFAAEYLYAHVYNCLSVFSGRELRFYYDTADAEITALLETLDTVFQLRSEKRCGYGKVVSIAERIGQKPFRFTFSDLRAYSPLPKPEATAKTHLAETLRAVCSAAAGRNLCGVDVGGTDIKLAACADGELVCTREYDWNPAVYPTAEDIMEPILLLTRLMRACLAVRICALPEKERTALDAALDREAPLAQIRDAVEKAERCLGDSIRVLDGVGVSFPDVIIRDRIVGGETPKTDGMRKNPAIDYEKEFQKLGDLKTPLLALCREGAAVHLTNDGNMAAFTAAVELAHSGACEVLRGGVLAHSLGTDLGTGWVLPDGSIPAIPLELYDLLLDIGSHVSRAWPADDLRSTRNENSGLPGVRRYLGQAAAFRLAYRNAPGLLDGFVEWEGETLKIAARPQDQRKACLEHLMRLADAGDEKAREVFRRIGEHLAVTTGEAETLLRPETKRRVLFGRFVKSPGIFSLLEEGFRRRRTDVELVPSDEGLACTPLMHALAEKPGVTVAQFGQAVGALYYACTDVREVRT